MLSDEHAQQIVEGCSVPDQLWLEPDHTPVDVVLHGSKELVDGPSRIATADQILGERVWASPLSIIHTSSFRRALQFVTTSDNDCYV
jgi:hypothetical protein